MRTIAALLVSLALAFPATARDPKDAPFRPPTRDEICKVQPADANMPTDYEIAQASDGLRVFEPATISVVTSRCYDLIAAGPERGHFDYRTRHGWLAEDWRQNGGVRLLRKIYTHAAALRV